MDTRARAPQRFTASHLREDSFKAGGLRPHAVYRDLGIAEATDGMAVAHVIRFVSPVTGDISRWHTHDVDLQMTYVLKGWIVAEMEGHAPETMREGSAWLQPPRIKHRVVDYSDDCELLEIVLPADFKTDLV